MKSLFRNTLVKPGAVIALAVAGMLGGGAAQAAGTASGTDINNLATLAYSVGTTVQTPIGSSPTGSTGAGTATTFKVDNKVNLTVLRTDVAAVSVVPGTNGVATFTVTNNGNSVQDFSLLAGFSLANGTTLFSDSALVTSTFNPASCSAFVESASVPDGYQLVTDIATFIDELAPDANKTVYVVCPISLAQINNAVAVVSLTATALAGGTTGQGVALEQTNGANTEAVTGLGGVDIVFADAAGTDDPARNASHSSRDAYKVVTATLKVTKTATPVCDPFNGDANPKNIPGSFVRYTILIANTGATSATLTNIADTLAAQVTFDADLIKGTTGTDAPLTTCASVTGTPTSATGSGFQVTGTRGSFPKYYTTTTDSDGVDLTVDNVVKVNFATVLPSGGSYSAGELKTGETVSVSYQVQIK